MGLGNLGFGEIMLVLVVVLLLFGAKRLPEIGASMGKGIREFKKSVTEVGNAVNEPARDERLERPRANDAPPAARDEDRPEPKRLLG
ncbi:MAG: twin-arginine translocase TatA/TatE family subunit [Gemmatimonadaceae bacterium]